MNIPLTDEGDLLPKKPERSFEGLLKEIQPKLENVPEDMRIAPTPPTEEALKAVKRYLSDKLKLTLEETPASTISVGKEFVERAKMHAGRVGLLEGLPVFAFLYPHPANKRFYAIAIYPRDGVDPRRIGQAIYWGLTSDIPDTLVQSKLLTCEDFWAIDAFDMKRLVDRPIFEKLKREANDRVRIAEKNAQELRKDMITQGRTSLHLEAKIKQYRADAVASHNRALWWKVISLILAAITGLLAIILMHPA